MWLGKWRGSWGRSQGHGNKIIPAEQSCELSVSRQETAALASSGQGLVAKAKPLQEGKVLSGRQGMRAGLPPLLTPSSGYLWAGTSCIRCSNPGLSAQKWDSRHLGYKVVMLCAIWTVLRCGRVDSEPSGLPGQKGTQVATILF